MVPQEFYYNLPPTRFGLDYDIFCLPSVKNSGLESRGTRPRTVPGQCYDPCNNAMLERESEGLTKKLCEYDSAFQRQLRICYSCQTAYNSTESRSLLLPYFQQAFHFCDTLSEASSSASTQTGTNRTITATEENRHSRLSLTSTHAPSTTTSSSKPPSRPYSSSRASAFSHVPHQDPHSQMDPATQTSKAPPNERTESPMGPTNATAIGAYGAAPLLFLPRVLLLVPLILGLAINSIGI